jgi:hypothetical protein
MLTAFNYESPKYLKMKGRVAELNEVMGKIYHADQVQNRIDAINVSSKSGGTAVSMKETLTDPRYRLATLYGVLLNVA